MSQTCIKSKAIHSVLHIFASSAMRCPPGTACQRCKEGKRACDGFSCCQRCQRLGVVCIRLPNSGVPPQIDIIILATDTPTPVKPISVSPFPSFSDTAGHITSEGRQNETEVNLAITGNEEAEEDKNEELKKFIPDDLFNELEGGLAMTYKDIEGFPR